MIELYVAAPLDSSAAPKPVTFSASPTTRTWKLSPLLFENVTTPPDSDTEKPASVSVWSASIAVWMVVATSAAVSPMPIETERSTAESNPPPFKTTWAVVAAVAAPAEAPPARLIVRDAPSGPAPS